MAKTLGPTGSGREKEKIWMGLTKFLTLHKEFGFGSFDEIGGKI